MDVVCIILPMKTLNHYSIKHHNSFAVDTISPKVYFPSTEEDLKVLVDMLPSNFYILGEGFNTLFVEAISPTIIKPEFKGIEIEEHTDCFIVKAAASENWHELVQLCIEKGINGLENLALIPGSVGAAPVQNIGAYGVELAQYCQEVLWFDFKSKQSIPYKHQDCEFSYRESIFKRTLKNQGLITRVTFCFPKKWQPNLSYAGLEHLTASASATQVMYEVIKIRQSKLPDPLKIPNAGSFFKNPVIEYSEWEKLIAEYPNLPSYPQSNKQVKIAAGWLIEQAGLKGCKVNGVGVHNKQALVLVNYEAKLGKSIANMALYVIDKVKQEFNITLEPEVRVVFSEGESNLAEYTHG